MNDGDQLSSEDPGREGRSPASSPGHDTTSGLAYSRTERFWLLLLAGLGFGAVNTAFLFGTVVDPRLLRAALANPVSLAFMAEALVLTGVFAYLLRKWRVARLGWGWFVALSLVGSMAFALPIVLLWPARRE